MDICFRCNNEMLHAICLWKKSRDFVVCTQLQVIHEHNHLVCCGMVPCKDFKLDYLLYPKQWRFIAKLLSFQLSEAILEVETNALKAKEDASMAFEPCKNTLGTSMTINHPKLVQIGEIRVCWKDLIQIYVVIKGNQPKNPLFHPLRFIGKNQIIFY